MKLYSMGYMAFRDNSAEIGTRCAVAHSVAEAKGLAMEIALELWPTSERYHHHTVVASECEAKIGDFVISIKEQ